MLTRNRSVYQRLIAIAAFHRFADFIRIDVIEALTLASPTVMWVASENERAAGSIRAQFC
ncbi:hypothetical protein MJ575_04775 [Klebsiella pneumoniae]|nr:hypothetical protein MJ575_04775 [Klebsiella pneumoniae]